ncbi:MAG: 50S ribosomal protein L16 3-hydroxylase [Halioglobus sp.]|jgi:50S ribosomal protein L16 3-hydroxylase
MLQWRLNLDRENFLANYWQRTPLLIPKAIPQFESLIDANELAGLALEEDVESRIVEFHNDNWQLHQGPFTEKSFDRDKPWTLLVQAVDHYVEEVAQLLKLVDFIPHWRIDDIMISYAVDGGSVGPHYDNYDVFLLQALGQREWRLGQRCDEHTALKAGTDLRIVEDFQCESQQLLGPGDILYVPPGVAHWGISKGEGITYSIGFRAPRITDLLSRGVDARLETISTEDFYRDPDLTAVNRPGEISIEDSRRAKNQFLAALSQQEDTRWFGELVTEPKYQLDPISSSQTPDVEDLRQAGTCLGLSPDSKLAWQQSGENVVVFANGESTVYSDTVLPMIIVLCSEWLLDHAAVKDAMDNPESAALIINLLELGCLELK